METGTHAPTEGSKRNSLPILPDPLLEEMIRRKVQEKRAALEQKEGFDEKVIRHFRRPRELPFTRAQRDHTTILFGGLTWKHEYVLKGAMEGLGYKVEVLPTPDVAAFQLGKEYGNNGQCNPTYFTVGHLLKHLQGLEAAGMSKEEIFRNYVFVTAGACGPCRFGMYEAEYRLALRNSGFDDFRVLLFRQDMGLEQPEAEGQGLDPSLDFCFSLLAGMNAGDLINDLRYQLRPFEVAEGETDWALQECVDHMAEVMKRRRFFTLGGRLGRLLRRWPKGASTVEYLGKFLSQLSTRHYLDGLRFVRNRLDQVEVDYLRVKPVVKITGEFWAQATEGDGNFHMFRFLEREGAQVLVEPVATWTSYAIHTARIRVIDHKGVREGKDPPKRWEVRRRLSRYLEFRRSLLLLDLARYLFRREFNRMRRVFGDKVHGLTDQFELQRVGHPYYDSRAGGGEGHMEVAKNIYYSNKDLCHMVLSLKPFGCMPSTQSDGAQSAVVNHFKDMIYLPIETSGEGEINAHSRVQMALGEAKVKAKAEFQRALESSGFSLDEIRAYAARHSELRRPMYTVSHRKGVVGVAANFVLHVADLMRGEAIGPGRAAA